MKLTKEDYMKLGLERCAELLVEKEEKEHPATRINWVCPYTGAVCVRWYNCFGCEYHPSFTTLTTTTTTTTKED